VADLRIDLLGGFRVAVGHRVVPETAWRRRRPAAVVKLLALAPGHRQARALRSHLTSLPHLPLDERAARAPLVTQAAADREGAT